MDRRQRRGRAGFTLVEILIAILIVATLIALLLPTIQTAFRRAKEAQATTEINNLATALAGFKQQFGDYPPSRVVLCEEGYNSTGANGFQGIANTMVPGEANQNGASVTDMTYGALAARSLIYLNKFWPRVNFNNPSQFHDFNGNGTIDPPCVVSGAECLVFFLGGIPSPPSSGGVGMTGFSKSPTFPFVNQVNAPNRTIPFYEFVGGRLKDLDHDGIPTYLDSFSDASPTNSIPYAYFSSYGANGYDPNDVNDNGHTMAGGSYTGSNNEQDEGTGTYAIMRSFHVAFPPNTVDSSSPNPYTTGEPMNTTGANYVNPNTFQLFCAGTDRLWGLGGLYLPNATSGSRLPINDPTHTNLTAGTDYNSAVPGDEGLRRREHDNLTNFSGGRLD